MVLAYIYVSIFSNNILAFTGLVNFFLQVDFISIKGTYPGYKNEKLKKCILTLQT